jgi:CubicO group peptidase (beta-lactamase class C family)
MTGGFAWGNESTGAYNEWIGSPDHVAYLLDRPVVTAPGTDFHYNSAAVHLLGVVLEEATGRPLPNFADQVLFTPLGIGSREWEALPGGRVNGGAGLDLQPQDLARLGQLVLQDGWSGNHRVIPAEWLREATATRFPWVVEAGPLARVSYGLLWWTDLDRNAFFAWGYGGQFVYVLPEEEIVVVTTTRWQGITAETGPRPLEEAALGVIVAVLEAAR